MRDYLAGMMRVELDTLVEDMPIEYAAGLQVAPGASWGTAFASAVVTTRTRELAKDGQDDLVLLMPDVRVAVETPGLDDIHLGPGDALLFSQARETRIFNLEAGASWALRVPYEQMARVVPRLGSAPVLRIAQGTPMLVLLRRYGHLLESEPLAEAGAQRMVARHLQDMAGVAIGASEDFRRHAEDSTIAHIRLSSIKADIAAHLGNGNLKLEWIAKRQGITPRHLQRLLARAGLNFTDMLRRARVARARALLEDPDNKGRTILSIALECGFPEASALNRAFRQEYGLRPGDVR